MYKSLIGALAFLGLLLFLCAFDPHQAAAATAVQRQQTALIATNAVLTATVPTTDTTSTSAGEPESRTVQHQRIVELPRHVAEEVQAALISNSFAVQVLYTLPNGKIALLVTKESAQMEEEVRAIVRASLIRRTQNITSTTSTLADDFTISNYLHEVVRPPKLMGNPHGVAAAAFDIPLSAYGEPGSLVLKQWALAQWALREDRPQQQPQPKTGGAANDQNDAGMAIYTMDGTRLITGAGEGVRIILFDTSPFSFTMKMTETAFFTTPFRVGSYPTLTLKVTRMITPVQILPATAQPTATIATKPDVRNHGLFAATLAYAVAPAATIELVEVLNHSGEGRVVDLTTRLHQLITESRASTMPIVINLSLGLLDGADPTNPEVAQLQAAISATQQLTNVAIVAAAGNYTKTGPMQWPARDPHVIGVGASNATGQLACFSKRVVKAQGPRRAAPGGDALLNAGCDAEKLIEHCKNNHALTATDRADHVPYTQRTTADKDQYLCTNLLMGLIFEPTTHNFHYAYWMGTSFATPLISGWVAVRLAQEPRTAIYASFTPHKAPTESAAVATGAECLTRANAQGVEQKAC